MQSGKELFFVPRKATSFALALKGKVITPGNCQEAILFKIRSQEEHPRL
jgi:hypothetical protein